MANLITLGRVLLLFLTIVLLYLRQPYAAGVAAFLIIGVYFSDAIDGYVARRRSEATTAGGIFDTAGDRIVENVYWIVFAHLGLISSWIPILMVTRSFVVDALRALALADGRTTFGETTMMESRLGLWLVASRLHRALYGGAKMVAHWLLAIQWLVQLVNAENVLDGERFISEATLSWVVLSAQTSAWFAAAYSLVRGGLVVYDARHYFGKTLRSTRH